MMDTELKDEVLNMMLLLLLGNFPLTLAVTFPSDCSTLWANTDEVQYMTSPGGFPLKYPAKSNICWIIKAQNGLKVSTSVEYLSLEKLADTPCNWADYLEIYDGFIPKTLLTTWCGKLTENKTVISSGSGVYILFRSDDTRNNGGFLLKYHAHPAQNLSDPGFVIDFTPPTPKPEKDQYFEINYSSLLERAKASYQDSKIGSGEIAAIVVGIVAGILLSAIVTWQWVKKYKKMKMAAKDLDAMAYMESLVSSRPTTGRPRTSQSRSGSSKSRSKTAKSAKSRGARGKSGRTLRGKSGRPSRRTEGKQAEYQPEVTSKGAVGSDDSDNVTLGSSKDDSNTEFIEPETKMDTNSINDSKTPSFTKPEVKLDTSFISNSSADSCAEHGADLNNEEFSSPRMITVQPNNNNTIMKAFKEVQANRNMVQTSHRPTSAKNEVLLQPKRIPSLVLGQRSYSDLGSRSLPPKRRATMMYEDETDPSAIGTNSSSMEHLPKPAIKESLRYQILKRAAVENTGGWVTPSGE